MSETLIKDKKQRIKLLEESLQILESEINWRQQNEKISFFVPNGKQEEFINKFAESNSQLTVLSASNALGKTTLLVNLLGNIVFGSQNKFFNQPIFKNWPFTKRARFITNPKLVEEIAPFHTEIQKWWPRGRYESIKSGKTYYSQYKANDWVIDVMSYDQEPSQFEGSTLGLALFDEPPPESLWTPTIRGLRGKGKACVFMTPLTDAAWFYDKVQPAHVHDFVYGQMEDGCKTHGIRGHLEHEEIQRQIAELMVTRPDEVEARIYGKAMYLQGRVFKTFSSIHICKEPIRPPLHSTIYNVVDPAADKPFFAIWAWPAKNGDIYIFDEHPNDDFFKMHNCQWTIQDYSQFYRQKEYGYQVKRIIDRHFANSVSSVNKKTLRQELEEIGMFFESSYTAGNEEIDTGVIKVREYLQYDVNQPITSINRPKLYVNPHCINTIKAFNYWSTDPKTGKYKDQYKDPLDCVRYLIMADPKQDEPIPYVEPKKRYG